MKNIKAKLGAAEAATLELRALYEQYGYSKYKMSRFEEYDLYAANMDFIIGDKVLTFTDLDGRLMALKPDVTLSIIKDTNADINTGEKLYYIENVCREDREGRNFTEIQQMGLEYLGNVDNYGIAEVASLAVKTLERIDCDHILEISHMSFVTEYLERLDIRSNEYAHLLALIRKKNAPGLAKVARGIGLEEETVEELMVIPTLFGQVDETVRRAGKLVKNAAMRGALDQISAVYEAMKAMNAASGVQADLSLVNDTCYYNGIIFRGFLKALGRPVLSGGQYDEAMRKFGKGFGAVGFGLYLNDISQLSAKRPEFDADVLLLYEKGTPADRVAEAVSEYISQGLSVRAETAVPAEMDFGKVVRLVDAAATGKGM